MKQFGPISLPPFKLDGTAHVWSSPLFGGDTKPREYPILWTDPAVRAYSAGLATAYYTGINGRLTQGYLPRQPKMIFGCSTVLADLLLASYRDKIDSLGISIFAKNPDLANHALPINSSGPGLTNALLFRSFDVPAEPAEYEGGQAYVLGKLDGGVHYDSTFTDASWNITFNTYEYIFSGPSGSGGSFDITGSGNNTGSRQQETGVAQHAQLAADVGALTDFRKRFGGLRFALVKPQLVANTVTYPNGTVTNLFGTGTSHVIPPPVDDAHFALGSSLATREGGGDDFGAWWEGLSDVNSISSQGFVDGLNALYDTALNLLNGGEQWARLFTQDDDGKDTTALDDIVSFFGLNQ